MNDKNEDQEELIVPSQIPDINKINEKLTYLNQSTFSERAFKKYKECISDYIVTLMSLSITVMIRRSGDIVSMADVETANSFLVAHSRKKYYERIGMIGGLLSGGAVGALLSMNEAFTIYSFKGFFLFGFIVVGAILIAISWAKDI